MKHKNLIIFLHGFGFDKTDNENFIQKLWNKYDAELVSLDAPFPSGRERWWFARYHITEWTKEHILDEKYDKSLEYIQTKINEELQKRNLTWSDLILVGRSQWAFMAMQIWLTNREPCKLIISIFGKFRNDSKTTIKSKPPLIWVEAEKDIVLSPEKKMNI